MWKKPSTRKSSQRSPKECSLYVQECSGEITLTNPRILRNRFLRMTASLIFTWRRWRHHNFVFSSSGIVRVLPKSHYTNTTWLLFYASKVQKKKKHPLLYLQVTETESTHFTWTWNTVKHGMLRNCQNKIPLSRFKVNRLTSSFRTPLTCWCPENNNMDFQIAKAKMLDSLFSAIKNSEALKLEIGWLNISTDFSKCDVWDDLFLLIPVYALVVSFLSWVYSSNGKPVASKSSFWSSRRIFSPSV